MKLKVNEKSLLLASSGLLAGLGTSISFVSVPAILASSDPLPVWKMTYKRGMKIALSTTIVTTLTGIVLYIKKEDLGYLLVSGLASCIPAFTFFGMLSTNKALFALEDGDRVANNKEIRVLVKKWDKLQYVRTFLGLGAFFATIAVVVKK